LTTYNRSATIELPRDRNDWKPNRQCLLGCWDKKESA